MRYLDERALIGGRFGCRVKDKKTGIPKTGWEFSDNVVTDEGLNKLLNVFLSTHAKITTWYVGLKSTTHVSSTMTYAVHGYT